MGKYSIRVYKETDTNKRFLLWGALMHITSDTYAHRSWTKNSSGNWVHIGSSDTDDTGKIPLRYDAAKKVIENIMKKCIKKMY